MAKKSEGKKDGRAENRDMDKGAEKSRMEAMAAEREKMQLQIREMTAKLAAAGLPQQPLAA